MPRQTADLIALILTCVVGFVVMATSITALWLAFARPDQDVSDAVDAIGKIVGVLVGALVGYMAGKRVRD